MPFDRTNPVPVSPAFVALYPDHGGAAGSLGWPLVLSVLWPGETTLACPACGSRDIVLTVRPAARGTGPSGRSRLGDNRPDVNACNVCRHTSDGGPHPTRK